MTKKKQKTVGNFKKQIHQASVQALPFFVAKINSKKPIWVTENINLKSIKRTFTDLTKSALDSFYRGDQEDSFAATGMLKVSVWRDSNDVVEVSWMIDIESQYFDI